MPVAGPSAADRAKAHYGWAERYSDAGYTRKAAAHFGRALDFGGVEGVDHSVNNRTVLLTAYYLVDTACDDIAISTKLRKMGIGVGVSLPHHEVGKRASVDVLLEVGRDEELVNFSVDKEDKTRLTYREMLRRFAIALDEWASRKQLDAGKRAYLQTHFMGHVYGQHIDDLETELLTKKRRKEAQKIDGHLDAKPRKRAQG